jgi:3'-phosphoadenosine 5'-phosphosulfate sulfotransferase (PAPS reductase)/FAD synthetase
MLEETKKTDTMDRKKTIAVWFSCGAASAVAAKKTIERFGETHNILIVNNPVKEEHEDNRRFLKDVEKWLGYPIIVASNKDFPDNSTVSVWDKRKYMSGVRGAPCTVLLKKEARHQFELTHKIDYHVLGFTVNEKNRSDRFIKYERENTIPVLIDAGLSKEDCFLILEEAGIDLPYIYKLGYPNANCIGCVKSSSPTYWNLVRKTFPEIFKQRAEQSRRIGCKLVKYKGKRIFLDELPEDAKGGKIKSHECGIFCETKI